MTKVLEEILKLSVEERILLVEAIWDTIPDDSNTEISNEIKQLLEERLMEHQTNPEAGSSWEEVKARLKKNL